MNFPLVSAAWILILAVAIGYVAYVFVHTPRFVPLSEGFNGVVSGSGHPDCLRTLQGAGEIMGALSKKGMTTEDGSPDFAELELILSKLACLKKDLMSPSGIVMATRHQPYETAHDREAVAEVAGSCLNQTIAPRDLDIVFGTWRDRGQLLLRRLCTSANLTESEVKRLEGLFRDSWTDVYEVAKGKCLKIVGTGASGGAGDEKPYEPPSLQDLRTYDGYFSGWTGQV